MAARTESATKRRVPLSRQRVLKAAVKLADRDGLEALTMRKLADELGVEAMSLYYHVANKEALLDGIIDVIVEEIEDKIGGFNEDLVDSDWKKTMRQRILAARSIMLKHPWAPEVLETRTEIGPRMMLYFNSLLGIFRKGGISYDLAHHALHALGSRAIGFTQELFRPDTNAESDEEDMEEAFEAMAAQLPYLAGMMAEVVHDDGPDETLGWCDDQTEFEFGLDVLLDGIDRIHQAS